MLETGFLLLQILVMVEGVLVALLAEEDGLDESEFFFEELVILLKGLDFLLYPFDKALEVEDVFVAVISLFFVEGQFILFFF